VKQPDLILPLALFRELFASRTGEILGCGVHASEDFSVGQTSRSAGGRYHGVALVGVHEGGGFEQPFLFAEGNGEKAMFVGVNQLPRLDSSAKNFDRAIPLYRG
jgi:hypothetical protein